MSLNFTYLPYSETNSFSHLVTDYLSQHEPIRPFYKYGTDTEGIRQAIEDRKRFPVDRKTLVAVLREQYTALEKHDLVAKNLRLLLEERTFTVCTAHQPNLLTGYLYFVYKIVHAIKLAEELKHQFPDNDFVPIYYMGSEDNDLEELGTFRYNGKKFTWDAAGQTGAVGRMNTESLRDVLNDLFRQLGPPGDHCEELKQLITRSYSEHRTISEATQYLVNELFGRFGLIVLNPDDRSLKRSFRAVMKDDLLNHTAYDIVSRQIAELSRHYKVQAHPRAVNLFYLEGDTRERIEAHNGSWSVVNTPIRRTEEALLKELDAYPERFSPNVILRGLFQETILPDVAFIGGGAEVAYWLQLRTLFEHYGIFYPSIHLRQSVLWTGAAEKKFREQLGLSVPEIFKPEAELVQEFIRKHSDDDWQTGPEMSTVEEALSRLKQKATLLDPTLKASAEAALAKIRYQMLVLEKKMLRAEKRKMQTRLSRISKLKSQLFPGNGLQERTENFMPFYLRYGSRYFDLLKEHISPLEHRFLVIEEN